MEKTRLNGGNKSKEKLSRFFTDTTRNKNNIEKRKNELRDRGMRASKHKNSGDQECRLFFRIMNVGGLNKTKLTLIKKCISRGREGSQHNMHDRNPPQV